MLMARHRKEETKPLQSAAGATIDVDSVFASMMAGPPPELKTEPEIHSSLEIPSKAEVNSKNISDPKLEDAHEETITITQTYTFAGKTTTTTKIVPKSSAEAKLYLSQQEAASSVSALPIVSGKPSLRRPKKRTSMFDTSSSISTIPASKNKLNTIEKSKLDWAGYVDKEGIKDELEGAEKSQKGYMGRMDFLNRVEDRRETEAREAREKGRG
jgi:Bucentaur or craniofacial development